MNLKAKFESDSSYSYLQALNSRSFQRGVYRVNLHGPTLRRLGDSLSDVTHPRSSPTRMIGCFGLKLIFVSFADREGLTDEG